MEQGKSQVNRLAGSAGALLGALIGGACIVAESRLGYVSIVSGVVMVSCTTKGWTLLGGRLDKLGAVICGVLMTVVTYHSNSVGFALEVMDAVEDVSFFTAFQGLDAFQEAKVIDGYWGQLLFLYLLVLVSSLPMVIGAFRKPATAPHDPEQEPHDEQPDLQGTFYVMRKDWMAPLRLSVTVPVLAPSFYGWRCPKPCRVWIPSPSWQAVFSAQRSCSAWPCLRSCCATLFISCTSVRGPSCGEWIWAACMAPRTRGGSRSAAGRS